MLDHPFMDAIGAVRDACDKALLERQALEERLQVDLYLGDVTWETAYGLPGEDWPPRFLAEVTLDWSTWSQTAFRNWSIGEPVGEPPEILIEVVMRVQRLKEVPEPAVVLTVLPEESPALGADRLERADPPTAEAVFGPGHDPEGASVQVSYEGGYRLDEGALADGTLLDRHLGPLGAWIASTLVRLGDLDLTYLPPDQTV
jgi:hypothetical protein